MMNNYRNFWLIFSKKIRSLLTVLLYAIGFLYLLFNSTGLIYIPYTETIWLICGIQLLRVVAANYQSSLQFVFGVTGVFLFYLPAPAITFFYNLDIVFPLILFILTADLFPWLTEKVSRNNDYQIPQELLSNHTHLIFILIFLFIWMLAGIFFQPIRSEFLGPFALMVPFGISLVIFERLIVSEISNSAVYFILLTYFVLISLHMAFVWSGFGRIVIAAFVLMPLLLINSYRDIGLRMRHVVILAPLILYGLQFVRYTELDGLEYVFIGSAGHHLILTNEVWTDNVSYFASGIKEFWEQYMLLFLNWFPRVWWEGKPIGAGWSSVEVIFGRDGYGEGYSHSLGYIGEQIYLLDGMFWVGLAIVLGTLILIRGAIKKLSRGFLTPVIIFDVNLISYIWGGQGIFGSRVWFFLIPVFIYIIIVQRFQLKKKR